MVIELPSQSSPFFSLYSSHSVGHQLLLFSMADLIDVWLLEHQQYLSFFRSVLIIVLAILNACAKFLIDFSLSSQFKLACVSPKDSSLVFM